LNDSKRAEKIRAGMPYAMRLDAAKAAERVGRLQCQEHGSGPNGEHGIITGVPEIFGDVVLARKDTPTSYQLAVVVDDAFQGVTLVTRGNDLFAAVHVQRLLQALLGLPAPDYLHHRLILDEHGRKFSKRDRSVTLRDLRANGVTPDEIRAQLKL
jgi:glutamyl-Q tRNA(Asp) synthetase